MFVPAEMSEVDIFVFENDVEEVAQTIARLGVMHLLNVNALGKWAEGVGTEWSGRISAYSNQERRVKELLDQLGIEETFHPCEGRLNPREDLAETERELQELEEKTRDLREREAELRRQLERWELVAKSMEILAPLPLSISDLQNLEYLHMVAGTMPAENLARLEASLFRIPYTIVPVHRYNGRVLVFAFCAQEHAPILDRALESAFLDPLALPEEFSGTAQEVLQQVQKRIQELRQKLEETEKERQALAKQLAPRLLSMLTRIRRNRAIAEAMAHFGHRGRVYLIAGWVPKDRVEELREAVETVTEGRVTFEENSPYAPGQAQVPTLLRNLKIFRPVESLVATYGIPGYREIDPTPLVGITFVLMFGIMFGDLGHGLVLAFLSALWTLGLIPRRKKRGPSGNGDISSLGAILTACGLSSSVFGVLYGSVFGMENVIPHLWLKPMKDIPTLLEASVAFGIVILNIGFILNLITAARENRFVEAIFDRNGLAGLLLYWTLLIIVGLIASGKGAPGWLWGLSLLLMTALFMARPLTNLLKKRKPLLEGSVTEFAIEAFFELFETLISYISNTLSYVRLGAFAVAHAGLSTVVFLFADAVGDGLTGTILRALILIFGNILIIGFEGLIVAIQTMRLEYYELFGKFFKGEGIPFKPLTLPEMECIPRQSVKERSSVS
ncbi:MAG: hypothetical protein J7M05_12640 [Anaerolineae bacterium]|nr:hypothetical protein [Anaerolineae bacterium]